MLVKAKWNVKDASGWHDAGEVFQTEQDLGDAVEVLDTPKKREAEKAPVEVPEKEPEKEPARPRNTSRRKVSK